jgi:hypothetical protein
MGGKLMMASVSRAAKRHILLIGLSLWLPAGFGTQVAAQEIVQPPPSAGEQLIVSVSPGMRIRLADPVYEGATLTADGDDLVVSLTDHGVLILRGFFFQNSDEPIEIGMLDSIFIPADSLFHLKLEAIEPAAGPSTFVALAMWFADRAIPEAAAATVTNSANPADPLLEQLLAQIEIARLSRVLEHYRHHLDGTESFRTQISRAVDNGYLDITDAKLAQSWLAEARILLEDTALAHLLAVDRHQERFKERLETAVFPDWKQEVPASLSDASAGVSEPLRNDVRRAWRQLTVAQALAGQHDERVKATQEVVNDYMEQWKIGQSGTAEVLFMMRLLATARVERENNLARGHSARARLIALTGSLNKNLVQKPGFQ